MILKTRSVSSVRFGATNDGLCVSAPVSVTSGPETCSQTCVTAYPSGSTMVAPSVTASPSSTMRSGPGSMTTGSLSALTPTVTYSTLVLAPSETSTRNLIATFESSSGVSKEGWAVSASATVTAGPETCVHEYDSGAVPPLSPVALICTAELSPTIRSPPVLMLGASPSPPTANCSTPLNSTVNESPFPRSTVTVPAAWSIVISSRS